MPYARPMTSVSDNLDGLRNSDSPRVGFRSDVGNHASGGPMDLQEIAALYPDWVIWRGASESGPGAWYATRRGTSLSYEQLNAGLEQTVCGDDASALVVELERQAKIAMRLAAERVAERWSG